MNYNVAAGARCRARLEARSLAARWPRNWHSQRVINVSFASAVYLDRSALLVLYFAIKKIFAALRHTGNGSRDTRKRTSSFHREKCALFFRRILNNVELALIQRSLAGQYFLHLFLINILIIFHANFLQNYLKKYFYHFINIFNVYIVEKFVFLTHFTRSKRST